MTVRYVNWIPGGYHGITLGSRIYILNSRRDDRALLEHEQLHSREQLETGVFLWWFKYITSIKFRVQAEVRAYRVSMAHGMRSDQAADWLMKYDSSLTKQRALDLLLRA